jgi:MFS family permease
MNFFSDRLAARLPFFYGYVMMPVAMMIQVCTSPGQTFAISAFTPAIRESLRLSDSKLSLAYMMGTVLAALPLSLVGPMSDRWGLRATTLVATVALSLTCLLASQVSGFLTLFLAFFALRFLGQGSLTLLSGNAISMWFRTKIGRVSAAMSFGTAITFAFVPEWIHESIESYGWRQTYQAMAVVVAVLMLPLLVLLFRNRPEDVGQSVDGARAPSDRADSATDPTGLADQSLTLRQAMRGRSFYILAVATSMWAMVGTGVVFYLFTLCDDRGFHSDVPADLFKTFGLTMLAAQLAGGVLADFWPLSRLLGIGTVMLALGTGMLLSSSVAMLHGFAVLFGGGQGLLIAVGAVVWVRYYGRLHLGSIRGTVWSLTVAGSGCGPLIMGVVRDHHGNFEAAIIAFFTILSALAVIAWWATPPTVGRAQPLKH